MKSRIKKFWTRLLAAILGILGFASCEPVLMYGSPHANFKALGTVKDEAGQSIEGIRVAVRQTRRNKSDNREWNTNDTLYTDVKGAWTLINYEGTVPDELTIVLEDIDGEAHGGAFKPAEVKPQIKQTHKGDNSWYLGDFEAKADVTLKK